MPKDILDAPSLALFPVLILLTVLSFNILGDVFRVAFEPKAEIMIRQGKGEI